MLYGQGYTIKGVQKLLREQGAQALIRGEAGQGGGAPFEAGPAVESPAKAPWPPRQPAPRPPPGARGSAADPARLREAEIALLRAALADLREAERWLRQARAG